MKTSKTRKTRLLTRTVHAAFDRRSLRKALLASTFLFGAGLGAPPAFAQIAPGTVMVSTGNGRVTEFSQTGVLGPQLDTTTGAGIFTAGSLFDTVGNFFVTDFNAQQVTKFDPFGVLIGPFGGPYGTDPESIATDSAGNFYVGQADGARTILKFDTAGTLLATFTPTVGPRGTDWTELGADQCTLYYTSEGADVHTFNACTNTQGPNFNVAPLPGANVYAHRLLPAGGMLLADTSLVVRLDAAGTQIQTYTPPGVSTLFALNLDKDGTSFWTADLGGSNKVFKIDIASGAVLVSFDASVAPNFQVAAGLSVKGEIITSIPKPCKSTDAVLANIKFPTPGTVTFDISSPTRVLDSIKLNASNNIGSSILPAVQAGGHSATGGKFVKANAAKAATFELLDNFVRPTFACLIDPLTTTLKINTGHEAVQAFHMIPKGEHFIEIDNGSPGLRSLKIDVNGKYDRTLNLQPGRTIRVDAAATMNLEQNTLTFTGEGKTGTFANISVSDSAPSTPASPGASRSIQATGIWGRMMFEKAAP